jgi:hypothetical protein
MRTTITAAVVLAVLALAAPLTAGTPRVAQHVRIEASGPNSETFVLTPMTSGRIRADTGVVTFCCWSTTHVVRAGETLDVNDPHLTFKGTHGTLRFRNRVEFVDLPDGWSVFTGTWKAVGGTGAYGSAAGSGRVVGVSNASGFTRVQLFGSLTSK